MRGYWLIDAATGFPAGGDLAMFLEYVDAGHRAVVRGDYALSSRF
jgi:hypothetical protein